MHYSTSKTDGTALAVSLIEQETLQNWRYAISSGYGLTIYLDEKEANRLLFDLSCAIAEANGEGLPE